MNVNNNSLRELSYAKMQNDFSSQQVSALQFNSRNNSTQESNEGKDNDSDDVLKNSVNSTQALTQLLNKQNSALYPTSSQNSNFSHSLSSKKALEAILMQSIESSYASAAKPYMNNPLDSLTGRVDIKA